MTSLTPAQSLAGTDAAKRPSVQPDDAGPSTSRARLLLAMTAGIVVGVVAAAWLLDSRDSATDTLADRVDQIDATNRSRLAASMQELTSSPRRDEMVALHEFLRNEPRDVQRTAEIYASWERQSLLPEVADELRGLAAEERIQRIADYVAEQQSRPDDEGFFDRTVDDRFSELAKLLGQHAGIDTDAAEGSAEGNPVVVTLKAIGYLTVSEDEDAERSSGRGDDNRVARDRFRALSKRLVPIASDIIRLAFPGADAERILERQSGGRGGPIGDPGRVAGGRFGRDRGADGRGPDSRGPDGRGFEGGRPDGRDGDPRTGRGGAFGPPGGPSLEERRAAFATLIVLNSIVKRVEERQRQSPISDQDLRAHLNQLPIAEQAALLILAPDEMKTQLTDSFANTTWEKPLDLRLSFRDIRRMRSVLTSERQRFGPQG